MDYMLMDRALMIEEPCEDGNCLQKVAGITCDAKDLGLTAQYDKASGKLNVFCDVQIRRFQSCMHLVREYEQDRTVNFDWVQGRDLMSILQKFQDRRANYLPS